MPQGTTVLVFKPFRLKKKKAEAKGSGGRGSDVARVPRAIWHDRAASVFARGPLFPFFLLLLHLLSPIFLSLPAAPLLTVPHHFPLKSPQISTIYLPISSIHSQSSTFPPYFSSFSLFHPNPQPTFSLSKILTSIVEVEGCSQ